MANTLKGIEIKTAILDEATVHELRGARRAGASYTALSTRFGVSRTQAFRIVHGECWAHLLGETVEANVPRHEDLRRIGRDAGDLGREEPARP